MNDNLILMDSNKGIISELPRELEKILRDFKWERNKIGWSKSKAFKLYKNDEKYYLKINKSKSEFNLAQEKTILEWLSDKLQVPKVIYYGKKEDEDFLFMSEISGEVSYKTESDEEKRRNIKILAEGLKLIHSIDSSNCPINNSPDKLFQLAKARMKRGDFDKEQFDER